MVRMLQDHNGHIANNKTQVLNKRKPVAQIPTPPDVSDHAEVYVMKGTNEVFTDYEKYLKRYDWLNQKKFTDAVNGKSGLTYWDALESETKSSATIENVFPEVLRDPILRKVQFSTTSRMDELVNSIYDEFKHDFFPGEEVIVLLGEGEQYAGVIREKAKFPMIRGADGQVQRAPFSRYFVRLNHSQAEEALLDDKHIRRDRKVFTKQNLRAFLKNSLQRESWTGAPWLVKEHLAIQYRLPMEIPAHLLQDAHLLRVKQQQQQTLQMRPLKGAKKGPKPSPAEAARMQQEAIRMQHMQMQQQHMQQQQGPGAPGAPPNQMQTYHAQQIPLGARPEPPRPHPPPIKYPIEDLDLPIKRNGVTRPELKFFTEEQAEYVTRDRKIAFSDIEMHSMGLLLECWNTLNVQCEVYMLDSFTFDDFVDAMCYSSLEIPCELLEEIHCAVLKLVVDDKGKLQVKDLPKKVEAAPTDDSEVHDTSEASTPMPDVPARSTRSRLSHVENIADSPAPPSNRAGEMIADRDWFDRLAARDFVDGGWQVIIAGILHQLSSSPSYKAKCDKILAHLAPVDLEPIRETALQQYASMDVNLRVQTLQILVLLTVRTDAVKGFLDTCAEDMTDVRKRKIEHQREKRNAVEELAAKDRERKILLPDNMPPSPVQKSVEPEVVEETSEMNSTISSISDEDAAPGGRALRRGNDRKRKREEDNAKREKERLEKEAAAKAQNKQSREFKKILSDIENLRAQIREHEEKIEECDADLREANVQRTKVLGKDRYCNRYYWFERNGQPFGGLPTSSTAGYGYANGRIWVQGPDEMEREGFIDLPAEEQAAYQRVHSMTILERRKHEEGATSLHDANEWGYYDDPARLDGLIGWLDEHGEREKKLRRELMDWKVKITAYMEAYKNFINSAAAKKVEEDEEQAVRVNTRRKAHQDESEAQERCLKWTNTMALGELGHLHSQPPAAKVKKSAASKAKGVAVPVNRSSRR